MKDLFARDIVMQTQEKSLLKRKLGSVLVTPSQFKGDVTVGVTVLFKLKLLFPPGPMGEMETPEQIEKKIEAVENKIDGVEFEINENDAELRMTEHDYTSSPATDLLSKLQFHRQKDADLRKEKADLRKEKADLRKEKEDLRQKEADQRHAQLTIAEADEKWLAGSPSSEQTMITLGIAIVEEDSPIFWDLPKADRIARQLNRSQNFAKRSQREENEWLQELELFSQRVTLTLLPRLSGQIGLNKSVAMLHPVLEKCLECASR